MSNVDRMTVLTAQHAKMRGLVISSQYSTTHNLLREKERESPPVKSACRNAGNASDSEATSSAKTNVEQGAMQWAGSAVHNNMCLTHVVAYRVAKNNIVLTNGNVI